MNIEKVASGDNDLARFMSFISQIDNLEVTKEDWGNMCGIIVSFRRLKSSHSICFNFYEDGEYRTIIDNRGLAFGLSLPDEEMSKKASVLIHKYLQKAKGWLDK